MLIRQFFVGTPFTASTAQFIARNLRDVWAWSIGDKSPSDAVNGVPTNVPPVEADEATATLSRS